MLPWTGKQPITMDTLQHVLWPILLVGGLGVFIDLLIGQTGQERTKDFLLSWWVRFDDVRWRNFGREEGLFAGRLIEKWLGKHIWSFRRIVVAFILFALFLPAAYVLSLMSNSYNISCYYCYISCTYCRTNYDYFIYYNTIYASLVTTVILYLTTSISFIKFITFRTAYLCGVGEARNLLVFLVGLIVYCIMLIYVSPWLAGYRESFSAIILRGPSSSQSADFQEILNAPYAMFSIGTYLKRGEIDRTALFMLACFPSLLRFAISIVFVGSFLLRPLIMRPLNLLWRRIIESEKPVFTLTFGGAAALATAISEAAKHL
jgi:hypothetical protein